MGCTNSRVCAFVPHLARSALRAQVYSDSLAELVDVDCRELFILVAPVVLSPGQREAVMLIRRRRRSHFSRSGENWRERTAAGPIGS